MLVAYYSAHLKMFSVLQLVVSYPVLLLLLLPRLVFKGVVISEEHGVGVGGGQVDLIFFPACFHAVGDKLFQGEGASEHSD